MFPWVLLFSISTCNAVVVDTEPGVDNTLYDNFSYCEEDWTQYEQYCFKYEDDQPMNWFNASDHCRSMGGHLASIHSEEENGFLLNYLSRRKAKKGWIGLHDQDLDGTYVWEDGSIFNYSNWDAIEPLGDHWGSGDCVELYDFPYSTKGSWFVYPCITSLPYLCQKMTITTAIRSEQTTTVLVTSPGISNAKDGSNITSTIKSISQDTGSTTSTEIESKDGDASDASSVANSTAISKEQDVSSVAKSTVVSERHDVSTVPTTTIASNQMIVSSVPITVITSKEENVSTGSTSVFTSKDEDMRYRKFPKNRIPSEEKIINPAAKSSITIKIQDVTVEGPCSARTAGNATEATVVRPGAMFITTLAVIIILVTVLLLLAVVEAKKYWGHHCIDDRSSKTESVLLINTDPTFEHSIKVKIQDQGEDGALIKYSRL